MATINVRVLNVRFSDDCATYLLEFPSFDPATPFKRRTTHLHAHVKLFLLCVRAPTLLLRGEVSDARIDMSGQSLMVTAQRLRRSFHQTSTASVHGASGSGRDPWYR